MLASSLRPAEPKVSDAERDSQALCAAHAVIAAGIGLEESDLSAPLTSHNDTMQPSRLLLPWALVVGLGRTMHAGLTHGGRPGLDPVPPALLRRMVDTDKTPHTSFRQEPSPMEGVEEDEGLFPSHHPLHGKVNGKHFEDVVTEHWNRHRDGLLRLEQIRRGTLREGDEQQMKARFRQQALDHLRSEYHGPFSQTQARRAFEQGPRSPSARPSDGMQHLVHGVAQDTFLRTHHPQMMWAQGQFWLERDAARVFPK